MAAHTLSASAPAIPSDPALVGHDGRWVLEKGAFLMQCGNLTVDINCNETKKF